MPVHDIHVDPARSGSLGFCNLLAETGKICRKNGWSDQETSRHAIKYKSRILNLSNKSGGVRILRESGEAAPSQNVVLQNLRMDTLK
jgi:hypothetical protein